MSSEDFLDDLYGGSHSKKLVSKPGSKKSKVDTASPTSSEPSSHLILTPLSNSSSRPTTEILRDFGLKVSGRPVTSGSTFESAVADRMIPLDNFIAGKPKKRKPDLKSTLIGSRKAAQLYKPTATFAEALQLYELWKTYVQQCQANNSASPIKSWFHEIELIGAWVAVTASLNPGNVGLTGIVIKSGLNAFVIVGPDGRKRTIPKDACDFHFRFPDSKEVIVDGKYLIRR